jgi:hypothetical protein
LKAENPEGKLEWDEAISTLERATITSWCCGDNIHRWTLERMAPGSEVVKYGGMFVAGCFLLAKLADDRRIPTWVFESFGVLLFVLLLLTTFFLAQQAYRALRRRKSA